MHQNFYPYTTHDLYQYHEHYDHYEHRAFQGLVGQFFTLQIPLTVPTGEILPPGTRVFIHRVSFTPAGIELVTIVFPSGFGGNCVAGSTQVSASQLGAGAGPGGVSGGAPGAVFGAPPRPPRPPR